MSRLRAFLKAKREDYKYRRATDCRLYDCFTYFNESELLAFRLEYLKDVVDHFVIVEADHTYSGLPKPQNLRPDLLEDAVRAKLRYSFIGFPDTLPHPPSTSANDEENIRAWGRETYQRMRLVDGLYDARDDDIVLITDVDEIPSRERLLEMKRDNRIARRCPVVALEMSLFFYDIAGLASHADGGPYRWRHPRFTARRNLGCTNLIRYSPPQAVVPDGGWHFTYFGGAERIRTKLKSYSHTEANTEEHLEAVERRVLEHRDIVGRTELSFSDTYDKTRLPDLTFSERYREFFQGLG